MNRNGTPAIILIYLMITLLVFMDRKSHCLAETTSMVTRTNLYSTFQDRLEATSNLAKSEYDSKTTETVGKIYDLVGRILHEQLKQQQEHKADSKETNYADKLVDEADPSHSHDILPPAVASPTANTATDVAKKNPELINAQVVGSADVNQLNHRQARKIRKESRRFCPRPHRAKKSYYTETSVARKQSSRPRWADRRMRPSLFSLSMPVGGDSEEWEISPISTQSETRQSAQSIDDDDADDGWRCRRSSTRNGNIESTAVEDVSGSETNELAENIGGSESSNQHGLPSDKWRRKLKIDGRIKNLRNCRSWPNLLEKQSNELFENDEEMDEADDKRRRKSRTITDPFPEIFAKPLVDSPVLPIGGAAADLNEALRNANSMLKPVPSISSNPIPTESEDAGHHISKPIRSFDITALEGQNPGAPVPHPGGDASLTNVMEKVLCELESLKACRATNNTQPPEGSPCDVVGTWNSEIIGLQFHFTLADPSPSSRSFVEGKKMEVEVTEKVPPRRHDLMDCDWYFTASTIKQFGGPFYITAQKTERYIVSTFAGLCKTCGGIPTIFGAWTFVYPAKDCHDVSLAVETKRDILRKDTLEAKRKQRLSQTNKGKCMSCG